MTRLELPPPGKDDPWEIGEVIFDEEVISARVATLARQIDRDYRGREICVIGILSGAFPFMCDLVRHLSSPLALDFLSISRYRAGGGPVQLVQDLQEEIADRDVLVLDDIVDTGLSLHFVVQELLDREPQSLAAGTLLARPELRLAELPLKYVGFDIDADFLVGYGLDYRGRYRDLPYIATMRPRAKLAAIP